MKENVKFENENTLFKALNSGKIEEFHQYYEQALSNVESWFGQRHPLIIDGEEIYSDEEFKDLSPIDTRIVLGRFQKAKREHVNNAVEVALRAFKEWSNYSYKERARIFQRAANIMRKRKFELAALITYENGKNRFEAIADVDEAIDLISFYAYQLIANDGYEKKTMNAYPNEETWSVLRPYGVWGVISPFNFPIAIVSGMSCGALITGNTIVLKPASDTPFTALKIYEIYVEAGVPKGAVNYITGPGEQVGKAIVESEKVSGIVFTGSKEVGVSSYILFNSKRPRPFIAEMGGKNAVFVSKNADLNDAVEGVVKAAFGFSGQKCSACSRIYVQSEVKEEFIKRLVKRVNNLKIGDPREKDTFIGPLINLRAYDNFKKYVEMAKNDGNIIFGGRALSDIDKNLKHGYYVEPTIVADLPRNHFLVKQELFVPILCIDEVTNLDEAIKLINDCEYGLTSGIFSEDENEIKRYFNEVEAGVIYANRKASATTGAAVASQPFVGWKLSGTSGKGAGGEYYLQQFLREQSRTIAK
jgi:1-pyrroline-5-carboxylate dehydrogenase